MSKPTLPDGLVAIVKRDCETCQTIVPALREIAAARDLVVYTQDDPAFPGDPLAIHDVDLGVSWHHDIETVPTLIRVEDGAEVDRTFGWSRDAWREFTGIDDLGGGLPAMRPGCGSRSVDPDLVDELRARHGGSVLRSRRIEVAELEDPVEMMFTRGWSDGLPVVPPTEERVLAMLTGTSRAPDEIVATVPPDLVHASVEKVAIAAVMAGCLPEYLPWVLTAVEAACNDEFNMHGLLATTMPVGPVVICSGPGTRAIGMNSGINALGQGNRANSTIGRALQLVIRNIGGGRPGEVDRAAHGNPGKLSFCFAENDADSPYGTLAGQHGVDPGVDAVTLFAGEGPRGMVDQLSRTPESLANSLAHQLQAMHHHKLVMAFDAIVVMGPEHARVFAEAGWDRDRILFELHMRLTTPIGELARGAGEIAEGVPTQSASGFLAPDTADGPVNLPKFRPDGLMLAYSGGGAGLFSMVIPGWVNGEMGSKPVTREVRY
ncbi:MAG: thioredoxin [Ilumatobacter sp.]|uniref:thioredoxin n=1 Tax=Ilumatobacter sp. TaxID=1967498 RepID=UPI00260CD7BF|nr:thioredoxin [Ilumatobacter sp.]MDJ0768878.1 thioredoxin [Ilumatobacter sp.]